MAKSGGNNNDDNDNENDDDDGGGGGGGGGGSVDGTYHMNHEFQNWLAARTARFKVHRLPESDLMAS